MKKYIELETVGTVLKEEFIEPYNLTIEQVANAISVPFWRLLAVVEGGEPMTADLDLLLTKYFGMSEGFFIRWQESYNARIAKKQLRNIDDLKIPSSNHLEVLSGNRLGQFSIRVNDKYRICFEFINNCAENVELVDYH